MLLSIDEAAQLLKLSRPQLYEICRNRSRCRQALPIPRVLIGRRTMFRRESLENWIKQLEQNAQ